MTTTEQKEQQKPNENKQAPETEIEVSKGLKTENTKVDTEIDAKQLKTTVDEKQLTNEQEKTKEELEKDLASGMKVSEAVGKWSTRLDTMDAWLTILPFVGDTMTSTAGLLFFMAQNQRLAKKYRLPRTDKFKAMMLQVGDRTVETLIKAPLNSIMATPRIGWITIPFLAPVNATVGFIADKIFKANTWTAKLFKQSFEKMLADAEKWNKDNAEKEQIDIVTMKEEMDDNMKKITTRLSYKNKFHKDDKKDKKKNIEIQEQQENKDIQEQEKDKKEDKKEENKIVEEDQKTKKIQEDKEKKEDIEDK